MKGGGIKHVACAEDEDFIQALDKMMLENLQVCDFFFCQVLFFSQFIKCQVIEVLSSSAMLI